VRQERLDEAKRASLMEAAIEEFAERGIESASYNKIIERSGLSKGTVYYYFDNKDSLLLSVLDEICERFHSAIGDLELPVTKENYWVTAREYNSRVVRFFFENPLEWRVLSMSEQLESFHGNAMRFIDALIVRGQELGAVRKDFPSSTIQSLMHALGRTLSAAMLGDVENLRRRPPPQSEEELVKIDKFVSAMQDLGKRILTPKEDWACLANC